MNSSSSDSSLEREVLTVDSEGLVSPMPKVLFRMSRLRLRSGGSSVNGSGSGFCVSLFL